MQPRRLAGVATAGVACRALAAGAAGVSAAWQPTGPGMYLLHQSLPPSSPAAAGSFVPQLGGSRTDEYGSCPLGGKGPGQREARGECGVGVGRSCRNRGTGVPWGSADSSNLVPDQDPGSDPSGSGPRLKWESLPGSIRLTQERSEANDRGRSMVLTHLPRDKWPGTRGEILGTGAGPVSSPVTSDPRALFPFEVKGQR